MNIINKQTRVSELDLNNQEVKEFIKERYGKYPKQDFVYELI